MKKKNKIAIIGSAHEEIEPKIQELCERLGYWLAENEISIISGACSGIPHIVCSSAYERGAHVIGYSPAKTLEEHINIFCFPNEGYNEILFLEQSFPKYEAFLKRSKEMLKDSEIVISIKGNWGTLNELTMAILASKTIINLPFSGGASKEFAKIYSNLKNGGYFYGEKYYEAESIEDLQNIILGVLN